MAGECTRGYPVQRKRELNLFHHRGRKGWEAGIWGAQWQGGNL